MIRKIQDNPEVYEHTNRHGVRTYRVESKPWAGDARFMSEQEFKDVRKKEKPANAR